LPGTLNRVYYQLESQWEEYSIKTGILRNKLDTIKSLLVSKKAVVEEIKRGSGPKSDLSELDDVDNGNDIVPWKLVWPYMPHSAKGVKHIPLTRRKTGYSLEEKIVSVAERYAVLGLFSKTKCFN